MSKQIDHKSDPDKMRLYLLAKVRKLQADAQELRAMMDGLAEKSKDEIRDIKQTLQVGIKAVEAELKAVHYEGVLLGFRPPKEETRSKDKDDAAVFLEQEMEKRRRLKAEKEKGNGSSS